MSRKTYRLCLCVGRMLKLRMAEPPEDIVKLFNQYSDKCNGVMTVENLHKFLVEVQGDDNTTIDDAQAIMDSLKHLHVFPRRGFSLDDFFRYLLGDLNPPLPPLGVHHDMNAPLAHYFIYTGHNSYLTGNQISSSSSIQPIVKALSRGVRVIELDLWPSPKKDDVHVFHGGTMTPPVELIKCLEAIKDNAFCASEYPVIITFEDHLDSSLQHKVAEMVTAIFGEMLYRGGDFEEFPSPETLKKRILISTKPPTESVDCFNEEESSENDKRKNKGKMNVQKNEMEVEEHVGGEVEDGEESSLTPTYSNLISIQAVKRRVGLQKLLKGESMKVTRLSLSEHKFENVVRTRGTDIIRFTQSSLLRVYPRGSRIFSSNYNPLLGWTHGAQMVAFNMQGHGKFLRVMQGVFRANGGCGYVKKPEILLKCSPNNEVFDPNAPRKPKKTLKLKLYMGDGWHLDFHQTQFDRLSPPNFFTKFQILGVPGDRKKAKTTPVEDQWVPTWNEELAFPLTVPELALLRIEVRNYNMITGKHNFGGQTCLPVSELRSGIRAIPLYDRKGDKYKHVRLLLRIQFIEAE